MSHVTITFKTDGEYFRQPSGHLDVQAVERMIEQAESKVWTMPCGGTINIRDLNGNTVGSIVIEEDD